MKLADREITPQIKLLLPMEVPRALSVVSHPSYAHAFHAQKLHSALEQTLQQLDFPNDLFAVMHAQSAHVRL